MTWSIWYMNNIQIVQYLYPYIYIYYVGAEYLIHRVSCFCILVLLCIPNMQGLSRCIMQSDLRHGRLMGAID